MIASLLLAAALAQPAPEASAAGAPAPAAPAAAVVPSPGGAPTDDYGFVAWCRGALTGHMELAAVAAPELDRVAAAKLAQITTGASEAETARLKAQARRDAEHEAELDREQMKAGREYLALYARALKAAEAAGAPRARGVDATGQGYRIWSAARAADPKDRMYAYLMWELPGRCETAAKTLESQSGLLGEAFRKAEAPASPPPADAAPSSAPEAPAPETAAPPLRPTQPPPGA